MFSLFWNCFERPNSDCVYVPSEVLSNIFSFLGIHDRKNVRLTCSQWYEACNTIPLIQDEKMKISYYDKGTKLWYDVLMNCPRLCFNIEFACQKQLPPDPTVFWEKFGPRVKSLKFVDSNFYQKQFGGEMMKFCNNLEKLHINESNHAIESNDWGQNLDESEIITHESLKCLVLESCPSFTDFHFSLLFNIYPRIEKLELIRMRINCHKRVDSRFYKNTLQFNSNSIFSFSCVFANIRSKAENIKALVLDRVGKWGLPDDWLEDLASLPGFKLKELTLIEHPLLTEKAFLKFFSSQTDLEYVKIEKCQNFSLKCFLHMIRLCSSLKTIKVEYLDVNPNFSMSKEIFQDLMKLSSLKTLKLKGMFFMEENVNVNRVTPASAAAFQRLHELTLKMPAIYFDIFVPKIPSNLTALHLITKSGENSVTEANLQLIFNKWIHLRSLKLTLDSTVSDFGFSGCRTNSADDQSNNSGISISTLKRLEKLALIFHNGVDNCITDVTFSHFVLPNLRKLKLFGFSQISAKSFKLLSENTPSMEYCTFEQCNIYDTDVMEFQGGWKSLRVFAIEPTATFFWRRPF